MSSTNNSRRSPDRRRQRRSPDRRGGGGRYHPAPPQQSTALTAEEAKMRDAKCVFVSQLQVKASEDDVELFFSSVCDVKEVALIKEKATGRSKGFGYVELATFDDVKNALLLSGLPF